MSVVTSVPTVPPIQSIHMVSLLPVSLLYLPRPHGMQGLESSGLNVPGPHTEMKLHTSVPFADERTDCMPKRFEPEQE